MCIAVGAAISFVAGLGPVKAHALQQVVSRLKDGGLESRAALVEKNLLKQKTFTNAAGFLRVLNKNK